MNKNIDYAPKDASSEGIRPGPYLARVVSFLDPTFTGTLEVEILRPVGNQSRAQGQLHQVKMMTPFYGVTSVDYVGNQDNFNNTQKSYGMWMVPPDVGTTVMVIFIDGDPKRGYWIGCVPDEGMNFMVPGLAATQYVSNNTTGASRVPVAEYNKKVNDKPIPDETKINKPQHQFATTLLSQGLIKDDIRGITTSSSRREVPSAVFGISTPGPLDKRSGAKTGTIGKAENSANNAFVSRLGGTTFVMDDGDDKFLRKTPANSGPPDYASVAQGETGGQPTIPHNELVRIRTRTGHQILMHNSEDLIYIGNASGTTWIELTSNGKIDIFAQDSVSIHTSNDLNVTADRDINFSCSGNFNINAGKNVNVTAGADFQVKAATNGLITVGSMIGLTAGSSIAGAASSISWNGGTTPKQATASPRPIRVPQHEPWSEHENLDPKSFVPSKTQASTSSHSAANPTFFQKPTTKVDPFSKTRSAK
jgi:Type VI secretion system/phage-baseplate injector OB domain